MHDLTEQQVDNLLTEIRANLERLARGYKDPRGTVAAILEMLRWEQEAFALRSEEKRAKGRQT